MAHNGFAAARRSLAPIVAALALIMSGAALAQVTPVDPDKAIDADLAKVPAAAPAPTAAPASAAVPAATPASEAASAATPPAAPASEASAAPAEPVVTSSDPAKAAAQAASNPQAAAKQGATYKEDDLIGAAEGVFGKGAKGLATMIKDLLKKQGEPNGYIVGREGGGAIIVGLRYGSGTLFHKVEGKRPVYWTGPSLGLDAGANAGNAFILVYNLYNTEDLFKRYGAGEGQAYLVGGFNASYLRRGDVVLIPVRMGVGLRLGMNAGYMKFSKKSKWLPF